MCGKQDETNKFGCKIFLLEEYKINAQCTVSLTELLFWPFFAQILQIWSNWNIKNDLYERFQKMKLGHKKSFPVTMKAEPSFVYITLDKFIVDIKIWFQISTLLIKCRFYLAALTPLIRHV